MHNRVTVAVCGTVVLLSILAGLLWWLIGFRRGAFQEISAGGFGLFLVLFAVFQVAACAIASALVWKFHRAEHELSSWPMIVLAGLLAFAALCWGVTPLLGMPVLLAVIVGGSLLLIYLRKSSARA
jgi:hypothetical protein